LPGNCGSIEASKRRSLQKQTLDEGRLAGEILNARDSGGPASKMAGSMRAKRSSLEGTSG